MQCSTWNILLAALLSWSGVEADMPPFPEWTTLSNYDRTTGFCQVYFRFSG